MVQHVIFYNLGNKNLAKFCDIIEQDCPKLWILFDVRADFLLISFMDCAIILLEQVRKQNKLTAEDEKRRTPRKQ